MKNFFFSFVLPAYKATFLKEAIESILRQSYQNFELIVVNDASPEDIDGVVDSYDDKRIIYYVNKENIGGENLVKNWNHCIKYAKGEYLILASDDDLYMQDFLSTMNSLINQYPDVDVLRSRVNRIDVLGDVVDVDQLYQTYMTQQEYVRFWSKGMIKCIANYVFKTSVLLNNGGFIDFPCGWFSDDSTVMMMAKNGIANTSSILFKFRDSGINISRAIDSKSLRNKLNAIDYFNEWITMLLTNESLIQDEKLTPIYGIHKHLVQSIYIITSCLCFKDIIFIIKYLFNNRFLYKKEKVEVLVDYLFTNIIKFIHINRDK